MTDIDQLQQGITQTSTFSNYLDIANPSTSAHSSSVMNSSPSWSLRCPNTPDAQQFHPYGRPSVRVCQRQGL